MSNEFEWSAEQQTLRHVVANFCTKVEPRLEEGFDRVIWQRLARDLSVAGLTIDPDLGGAGASMIETGVVAEELGRALVPTPLIATVGLAVTVLNRCAHDTEVREVLEQIADGSVVATAALTDAAGMLDPQVAPLAAREEDGVWYVDGTSSYVLEGASCDVVVCHANAGDEAVLLLVHTDSPGLERQAVVSLDQGRSQAHLTFEAVSATRLLPDRAVSEVVEAAVDAAATLLAMEQTGIAAAMLDLSVAHAKSRLQFGRAIGSFQAVKHRLADMYIATESGRSASYHALWAVAEGVDDPRLASSLAFTAASEAARVVTRGTVQVHGGIGFTWEHPAHRYLKAATCNATLTGGARLHGRRLAELGLTTSLTEVGA